jgi:hypothetical protein
MTARPAALVAFAAVLIGISLGTDIPDRILSLLPDEGEAIDAKRVETDRRLAERRELADALVAGRATLADTAARFLALGWDQQPYLSELRRAAPGAPDAEAAALATIRFALTNLNDPDRVGPVRRRLADEFRALYPYSTRPPETD